VRVLVAGGAGYIGSDTCKALARAGHLPIAYDNLHTGHPWAVKWGPLIRGDINDPVALATAIREHRPDAVINFAALAYVGESMIEPIRYYRSNVAGMITLIEVMRKYDVGSLVFSSSCATLVPRTAWVPSRCAISMPGAPIPKVSWARSTIRKRTSSHWSFRPRTESGPISPSSVPTTTRRTGPAFMTMST